MDNRHRNPLASVARSRLDGCQVVIQIFGFGANLGQGGALIANRRERGF
jgi:hypothetical protein